MSGDDALHDSVICAIAGGVATVTLNRPLRGNALNGAMGARLLAVIDQIGASDVVRVVLLRAEGKIFCVGGDIDEMLTAGAALPEVMGASVGVLHECITKLASLPMPVVSVVGGALGGGGIGLALCADLVLAAESMKLRAGYSAIGLTPDLGSSWFLAKRAGVARAKEVLFLNRVLGASACLAMGIVDAVHPDAELAEQAARLAGELAQAATGALGRIKRLVDGFGERTLEQHLAIERAMMIESTGTADGVDGIAAFAARRPARFVGR
jgi:2-(1,2-epoxy-1,2-dihydrophenyl)acetyl-CoA isomerase